MILELNNITLVNSVSFILWLDINNDSYLRYDGFVSLNSHLPHYDLELTNSYLPNYEGCYFLNYTVVINSYLLN